MIFFQYSHLGQRVFNDKIRVFVLNYRSSFFVRTRSSTLFTVIVRSVIGDRRSSQNTSKPSINTDRAVFPKTFNFTRSVLNYSFLKFLPANRPIVITLINT